jgi:hypothetical protein
VKFYNATKLEAASRWEPVLTAAVVAARGLLLPVHLAVRAIKRLCRVRSPAYLVADGFLIGDAVLLRPLVKAAARSGRPVTYLGGTHVATVMGDVPGLDHLDYQWPWARYDYSPASAVRFVSLFWRLVWLTPEVAVEARGDFRSLAVLSVAWCGRIVGFAFTGGRPLLAVDAGRAASLDGRIAPPEEHNRALAEACGLAYDSRAIAWEGSESSLAPASGLALSFSGSQAHRVLSVGLAGRLFASLECRAAGLVRRLPTVYLEGPADRFVGQPGAVEWLASRGIVRLRGTFEDFFRAIRACSAYVGVDSAGAHLASIFDIPALVCFTPNAAGDTPSPSHYSRPVHDRVVILDGDDDASVDRAAERLAAILGPS